MAFTVLFFLLLAALHGSIVAGLRVTPGSPCAAFCLDDDADASTKITTKNDEITCYDDEFSSTPEGQKFQRCLTCLQDSTFSAAGESDVSWYLYNLRFSFSHCLFGPSSETGIGSNPCVTSEACGALQEALKDGLSDPTAETEFEFCGGNAGTLAGDSYDRCYSCVAHDFHYLSNFLVALDAGCQQQPAPGAVLGINETVFTDNTIQVVDPSAPMDGSAYESSGLTTAAIAGIAVGAVVVLLFAVACGYMQFRKRKNRAARASRIARSSGMSFRCQTHLTPRSPSHFAADNEAAAASRVTVEKPYVDPAAALSSNPIATAVPGWPSKIDTRVAVTSLPSPRPIHASPSRSSPVDYTTPTSTTSLRSNVPLLTGHSIAGGMSPPQQDAEERHWGWNKDIPRSRMGPPVGGRPVDMSTIKTSFPPPPKKR
jgi:hypothetical protein